MDGPVDDHLMEELSIDPVETLSREYSLLKAEDKFVWTVFVVSFLVLLLFDNLIIFAKPRSLSFSTAVFYTIFWASTALAFCFFVGMAQSPESAYMWFSGYTLQWMMSFDNLFVFHLIFKVYRTPDKLKHRPLFLGILGQAVFTFALLTIGEWLFHTLFFLHMVFGLFFIYIGVASMQDDDDDDPSDNPVIQWLRTSLPFVNVYDIDGHFFVRLPIDDKGDVYLPRHAVIVDSSVEAYPILAERKGQTCSPEVSPEPECMNHKMIDISKLDLKGEETKVCATMLFLVVCTMEITDVIFSVDTIVAVSVQVGDLFLAFTCVAFALLTLRATFFIVEVLVQMFSLMKYAIGAILIYIGSKLLIDRWYIVPHLIDLAVLIGLFGCSIIGSAILDHFTKSGSGGADELLSNASPRTSTGRMSSQSQSPRTPRFRTA